MLNKVSHLVSKEDSVQNIVHLHLSDAFIQSDLHCIQVTVFTFYQLYILSALAFPGNRTHDLGVASAMLYYLSYRKAIVFIK